MTSNYSRFSVSVIALLIAAAPAQSQTAGSAGVGVRFSTQQPPGESLATMLVGQDVTNSVGEKVGDVSDLLFDKSGRITMVVIGVGGFLGLGEKYVAVPFDTLAFSAGVKGERVVTAPLSKEALQAAPEFKPVEKTTFMKAKEKAGELLDKAGKKIEDMRREEPGKK